MLRTLFLIRGRTHLCIRRSAGFLLYTVLFLMLLAPPARAQGREGIAGTLRNDDGRPVAGVVITVTRGSSTVGEATTVTDGSWRVPVPGPGTYSVTLDKSSLPKGVVLRDPKRRTLNGVEVTDTGFEIRPNEDLRGFEVELTTQMASITGMVTDARGNAARDYTVLIFPRDRERWESTSRYLSSARPDQDGRYKAQYVLPGAYYAIALDYVEQGANSDPDFLERIKERAIEFSIADTEIKSLDLKLVTGM